MKKQDAATLGYALVFAGLVFWLIKSAKGFWWWVLAIFIIAPIGSWIGWALGKSDTSDQLPVTSYQ